MLERVGGLLRPADLILLFAEPPSNSAVYYAQRAYGFPESICAISHVGIYVGDGQVVHSQPVSPLRKAGGIRQESLSDVILGRTVVCLRLDTFAGPLDAEPHLALTKPSPKTPPGRICALAKGAVGGGYDYRAVVNLAIDALRHKYTSPKRRPRVVKRYIERLSYATNPATETEAMSQAFICSDLAYNCYDAVMRHNNPLNDPDLMRAPSRLPAEFFLNPRFVTVDLIGLGPHLSCPAFGPITFGGTSGAADDGPSGPVVRPMF